MFFGQDLTQLAFVAMVIVAVGGVVVALAFPLLTDGGGSRRVKAIAEGRRHTAAKPTVTTRLIEGQKDSRRKQIQETLKQIEQRQKAERRKRMTLRTLIMQSGLDIQPRVFWLVSFGVGALFAVLPLVFGLPWYISVLGFGIGTFGFPRWFLGFLRRRRQNVFLNEFADAIDVMVRGLKAGLPVSDAMKVIAAESGPPVGPEFLEVVEGQRIGIAIDQGIERMYERMPLSEVNFLGIVMTIQSKTGGNLSEALSNLSKVLRDRKKMKAKIRAISQEAKSSAAIIGSLPFIIMGALTVLNPEYLNPLFNTSIGNIMLVGSAVWMTTGVLVMRKMINFQI
ncbi:MAG: type II secretion system F family protein [Rhizobiales bacterium]|nr:type II secretion system F family protein [Hyphomicrobiales bacterium]MBI3673675.1 type II secretion system F family protein [Hyphomicrobiales bacterium]